MSANGLHRIRRRRVAVERVHRTRRISLHKRLTDLLREGGGIVGERTSSDPMEMGCFDKTSSDAPLVSLRDT